MAPHEREALQAGEREDDQEADSRLDEARVEAEQGERAVGHGSVGSVRRPLVFRRGRLAEDHEDESDHHESEHAPEELVGDDHADPGPDQCPRRREEHEGRDGPHAAHPAPPEGRDRDDVLDDQREPVRAVRDGGGEPEQDHQGQREQRAAPGGDVHEARQGPDAEQGGSARQLE